jgi:AcrR family transcriptional regulator
MKIRQAIEADNPSPKYVQLVETAHDLFWRYGIKRVTIEEICRTAGVSKMTFYSYFKNKVELALYVLRTVFKVGIETYHGIMEGDSPFEEKVAAFIQLKLDANPVVSQEILDDLLHSPLPEIAEFIQQQFQHNVQLLLADLTKAQEKGEIRKDVKPEFLLFFIQHMVELASDERLTGLYDSPQGMTQELLNLFFYGILPRHLKGDE